MYPIIQFDICNQSRILTIDSYYNQVRYSINVKRAINACCSSYLYDQYSYYSNRHKNFIGFLLDDCLSAKKYFRTEKSWLLQTQSHAEILVVSCFSHLISSLALRLIQNP